MNEDLEKGAQTGKEIAEQGIWQLFDNPFVMFVLKLFLAIFVVGFLLILSKIISSAVKKKVLKNSILENEEYMEKVGNLIGDIIYYTLFIFSVFIGFEIIGFDLGILLGGLSFGLGFAFKEILGNMMAGILVLTTKDYKLGDIIEIEGIQGKYDYIGYIEEITIRYTTIRDFNNQKIIIPNLTLITNPIKTFTSEEYIKGENIITISNNEDIDKIKELIINKINEQEFIMNKEKTEVIFFKYDQNGANLKIRYYFDPNGSKGYIKIRSKINEIITNILKENNIYVSYPHTIVKFDKQEDKLINVLHDNNN